MSSLDVENVNSTSTTSSSQTAGCGDSNNVKTQNLRLNTMQKTKPQALGARTNSCGDQAQNRKAQSVAGAGDTRKGTSKRNGPLRPRTNNSNIKTVKASSPSKIKKPGRKGSRASSRTSTSTAAVPPPADPTSTKPSGLSLLPAESSAPSPSSYLGLEMYVNDQGQMRWKCNLCGGGHDQMRFQGVTAHCKTTKHQREVSHWNEIRQLALVDERFQFLSMRMDPPTIAISVATTSDAIDKPLFNKEENSANPSGHPEHDMKLPGARWTCRACRDTKNMPTKSVKSHCLGKKHTQSVNAILSKAETIETQLLQAERRKDGTKDEITFPGVQAGKGQKAKTMTTLFDELTSSNTSMTDSHAPSLLGTVVTTRQQEDGEEEEELSKHSRQFHQSNDENTSASTLLNSADSRQLPNDGDDEDKNTLLHCLPAAPSEETQQEEVSVRFSQTRPYWNLRRGLLALGEDLSDDDYDNEDDDSAEYSL